MKSKRDRQYFAKWLLVLEAAVTRIGYLSNEAHRFIQYKTETHNFTKKAHYQVLLDLALMAGVCPVTLGALPESHGIISARVQCRIRLVSVPSVFTYLEVRDQDEAETQGFWDSTGSDQISRLATRFPPALVDVDLTRAPSAVLVSEHRNIMPKIDTLRREKPETWGNVVVCLVSCVSQL